MQVIEHVGQGVVLFFVRGFEHRSAGRRILGLVRVGRGSVQARAARGTLSRQIARCR